MECTTRYWDLNIPSELLREILPRLGLKDNIRASVVCKTWCEAAVAVRKLQPRPWFFYREEGSEDKGDYILSDPSLSQTYKLNFPDLKKLHEFSHSRDGWLLVLKYEPWELLLLNPFTWEHIYLPKLPENSALICFGFSAAPTSSSCLVFSLKYKDYGLINIWRPGETLWTTHRFKNHLENQPVGVWHNCVFSNGLFYFLSTRGFLGVFDPSKVTWINLPLKLDPHPGASHSRLFMAEHEGDIFLGLTRGINNPSVFNFKLNLNRNVWEETRELGGLTVFASLGVSLARAGLPSEMRNRIYTSFIDDYGRHDMYYYSLGDEKCSRLPSTHYLPYNSIWVDPSHNVNL